MVTLREPAEPAEEEERSPVRFVGRLLAVLLVVVLVVAAVGTVAVGGLLAWVTARSQPHLVDDWITGRTVALPFTTDAVEAGESTRLVLQP